MASRRVWHGFRLINGRLVRFGTQNACDAMLIVCPNCSTSYAVEPTSLGAAGRTVRCARCKSTWFAEPSDSAPAMAAVESAANEPETSSSPGVIRDRDVHPRSPEENTETPASSAAAATAEAPIAEPVAISDAPSL